jgi:hypothetical protein
VTARYLALFDRCPAFEADKLGPLGLITLMDSGGSRRVADATQRAMRTHNLPLIMVDKCTAERIGASYGEGRLLLGNGGAWLWGVDFSASQTFLIGRLSLYSHPRGIILPSMFRAETQL